MRKTINTFRKNLGTGKIDFTLFSQYKYSCGVPGIGKKTLIVTQAGPNLNFLTIFSCPYAVGATQISAESARLNVRKSGRRSCLQCGGAER